MSTIDLTRSLVNEWALNHKDQTLSHWFSTSTLKETPVNRPILEVYCSHQQVSFGYPDSILSEANLHVENEARQRNSDPIDTDVHYQLLSEFIENNGYPLPFVNGHQVTEQDVFSEPDEWHPFEVFQFTDDIVTVLMHALTNEDPLSQDSKAYREGVDNLLRVGLSEEEILGYIDKGVLSFLFDPRDVADWCVDEVDPALKDALIEAGVYRVPAHTAQQNENLWNKATKVMLDAIKTVSLLDVTYKAYGVETSDIDRVLNLLEFQGVD